MGKSVRPLQTSVWVEGGQMTSESVLAAGGLGRTHAACHLIGSAGKELQPPSVEAEAQQIFKPLSCEKFDFMFFHPPVPSLTFPQTMLLCTGPSISRPETS